MLGLFFRLRIKKVQSFHLEKKEGVLRQENPLYNVTFCCRQRSERSKLDDIDYPYWLPFWSDDDDDARRRRTYMTSHEVQVLYRTLPSRHLLPPPPNQPANAQHCLTRRSCVQLITLGCLHLSSYSASLLDISQSLNARTVSLVFSLD